MPLKKSAECYIISHGAFSEEIDLSLLFKFYDGIFRTD